MISTLFASLVHRTQLGTLSVLHVIKRQKFSVSGNESYREYYKVLGLKDDSDREQVRQAFICLAKKYHPDSQNQDADGEKFAKIETAYRKLQEKFTKEKLDDNTGVGEYGLYHPDVIHQHKDTRLEHDIEHTAPQHRQFLNNDGIGHGTPYQREKQYQQHKVLKAIENVNSHRVSQVSPGENAVLNKNVKAAKKVQTRYGIERLVEDLIQESMSKGEFQNLKGSGKPLEYQNHNPFIDVVTHKVNQVLIENGFSPQWVTLDKDIRLEVEHLKRRLKERSRRSGGLPLSISEETQWKKYLNSLEEDVQSINKKIDNFNLVVPLLNKQKVHINLRLLSEKILAESRTESDVPPVRETQLTRTRFQPAAVKSSENGLLSLFSSLWK